MSWYKYSIISSILLLSSPSFCFFDFLFGTSNKTEQSSLTKSEPFKFEFEQPEVQYLEGKVLWTPSRYEDQKNALGYSSETFSTPEEFRERVSFWKNIYTKYSSWQGVIHHPDYPSIVYKEIDFTDIEANDNLSRFQKRRQRRKRVKEEKKALQATLRKLATISKDEALSEFEQKILKMFEGVSGVNKLKSAASYSNIRFQLGQRDFIIKGIYDSGRYLNKMEEIFLQENLPLELTRLPFVESSFNLKARSKVGASGIWQFMRSTAKQYMKVNQIVDQRNDPIIATKAAAKKLRNNYNKLGNWPLALTAYNYGPTGLYRLTKKYKTDDLGELIENVRSRRFGFASKNFYASFLAILEVEKKASTYYGEVFRRPELEYEEIKLAKRISYNFLKTFFEDKKDVFEFNPHLTRIVRKNYVSIPKRTIIRVPASGADDFHSKLSGVKELKLASGVVRYGVEHGDTLSYISQKFGVSVVKIVEANNLLGPHKIFVGQKLLIPIN